jgi:hypothetical protein
MLWPVEFEFPALVYSCYGFFETLPNATTGLAFHFQAFLGAFTSLPLNLLSVAALAAS